MFLLVRVRSKCNSFFVASLVYMYIGTEPPAYTHAWDLYTLHWKIDIFSICAGVSRITFLFPYGLCCCMLATSIYLYTVCKCVRIRSTIVQQLLLVCFAVDYRVLGLFTVLLYLMKSHWMVCMHQIKHNFAVIFGSSFVVFDIMCKPLSLTPFPITIRRSIRLHTHIAIQPIWTPTDKIS